MRLPLLPSKGGPEWIEIKTQHFTLWTDTSTVRAYTLVQRLERVRSVIYTVAFPELPGGGTTLVVAPSDFWEYRVFAREPFAVSQCGSPLRAPIMMMPADADADDEVVAHELAHAISFDAMPRQPPWFAEGFATFFETVVIVAEHGAVGVGAVPDNLRRDLRTSGAMPAADLFVGDEYDLSFEATSWAAFAYLQTKEPARLHELERLFASQRGRAAWRHVFPELTASAFDQALAKWLTTYGYVTRTYRLDVSPRPATQRALGDGDVLAIRALLFSYGPFHGDFAATLADATRADPTNVLARTLDLALRANLPSLEVARSIAAAHPDSWLAWLDLALAAGPSDEGVAAGTKACTLAAAQPSVLPIDTCDGARWLPLAHPASGDEAKAVLRCAARPGW